MKLSEDDRFIELKAWFDNRAREIENLSPEERADRAAAAEVEERAHRDREVGIKIRQVIPELYRDCQVEIPELKEWLQQLLSGDLSVPSLLITGPRGVGKTGNACAILREIIQAELPGAVMFVKVRSLLRRLRPGGDATEETMKEICDARFVCLDDLVAYKGSEWAEEQLLEIVDDRYMARRPMILTVDLEPSKLSGVLGDRVASRLAEMCRVVALTGPDRRRSR